MGLLDPGTGKIRLSSEQCATCLGNPRAGVVLRPGRMRELIRANTGDGKMGLVCHATIDYSQGEEPDFGGEQALCRWFYDNFGHLVNGVRVMLRLGGFTEVPPPVKEGTPAMPGKLPERESAVLRIIEAATSRPGLMATGPNMAAALASDYGLEGITPRGAHALAASLVRKGLAQRAGTPVLQWYKMTQAGRQALAGNQAGKWVA